jgi:hypothetical protein
LAAINKVLGVESALPRANWRNCLVLVLSLLVVRVVYLVWLCPYELVADEAHYWEWSRRLALSYYSKGPGVAWVIWASTKCLGNSEWAIRLPAAIASALACLALARLATDCSQGDERAGFFAAVIFILIPVFHGTAQFMTIDGPYILCWILAAWVGWNAIERHVQGSPSWLLWIALGLALGGGFLFKYTSVLLIPGLLGYGFLRCRPRGCHGGAGVSGILLATAVFLMVITPVLVWNHQQGWPTLSHLLGRLHLPGGDLPPRHSWAYNPLWTLGYIVSPLAFLGPLGAMLLVVSFRLHLKQDRLRGAAARKSLVFSCCCAAPIILFYLLVSLGTSVELNWSVAGYTTLLVPTAQTVVAIIESCSGAATSRGATTAAAADGSLAGRGSKPGCHRVFIGVWRWFVASGMVVLLTMSFAYPTVVMRIPVVGPRLAVHRIYGHRLLASRIDNLVQTIGLQTGREPLVVADSYWQASLLAYYMRQHPTVYSAASRIGSRKSAYDYFVDTDLSDPRLLRRTMVMLGAAPDIWAEAFKFERVESVPNLPGIFVGTNYAGPRMRLQ